MLLNVNPRKSSSIVTLSRNQNTDKRAFTRGFTSKHRNLDTLLNSLRYVPIDGDFCHVASFLHTPANIFNHDFRILVSCHVEKNRQSLFDLVWSNTKNHSVILNANSVDSISNTFVQPENHLSGEVVHSIQSWVIELKLVLAISIIILCFHFCKLIKIVRFELQGLIPLKKYFEVFIILDFS